MIIDVTGSLVAVLNRDDGETVAIREVGLAADVEDVAGLAEIICGVTPHANDDIRALLRVAGWTLSK